MRIHVILDFLLVAGLVYLLPYIGSMLLTSLAAVVYFKKAGRKKAAALEERPSGRRFLVAIPAHNEEGSIAETVRSCRAVDYPASLFDVLVVADNCTDSTASRARGRRPSP